MSRVLNWLFTLRWLLVIYGLAAIVACWDITSVQRGEPHTSEPVLDYPDVTANYAGVSRELYPNRISTQFWTGYAAFQQGRFVDARTHFEAAIAKDPKNNMLLYSYAVTLAVLDEHSAETEAAIAAWKWNYPHSSLQDPLMVARDMAASDGHE